MTLRKSLLSLVFVCLLLVSLSGTVLAQAEYKITETELARLEQIFNQLWTNNQALLNDLELSKQDLTTAQQKLATYQQELQLLQSQLLVLRDESMKAQKELKEASYLLKKANESLNQYEQEVRSEIRSLTWQRNGLVLVALVLALR